MTKPRLIVVDDDSDLGAFLVEVAELTGYEASAVTSVGDFMATLATRCPEIVIVDVIMPDADGIELLRSLAARQCRAGIILISGYDQKYLEMAARIAEARGLWVIGVLPKPIRLNAVQTMLSSAKNAVPPDGRCPYTAPCPDGG